MLFSATYICPMRGLISLEPPEPTRLGQASKAAKTWGLQRLLLPILEESLLVSTRAKVAYLDGLIRALDQVGDAALTAWLIAPAQRMLGLDFVPPYLVKAGLRAKAGQVYVGERLRDLCPYAWWVDTALFQKRIRVFREIIAAVHGHPALTGWLIMDRALAWPRPDPEVANFLLKSYVLEIREREESTTIYLCLGWSELLDPVMAQGLAGEVDGVHMSGMESELPLLEKPTDLASELLTLAYLGTMAQWLFRKKIQVETGWGALYEQGDPEDLVKAGRRLKGLGVGGINWLSLVDPDPAIQNMPPWVLNPALERIGLLDHHLEPKEDIEIWQKAFIARGPKKKTHDFIDIGEEEYLGDPHTHLPRLWEHFRESNSLL